MDISNTAIRQARPLRRLNTRLRAPRLFSLPLSVLPVFIATAVALPPADWDWWLLFASALAVALLHAAGNLSNDYFDFLYGVDQRVEADEERPGRFLVRGELTPRDVWVEAAVCLALALPVVAYLVWRSRGGVLWFGGAAAFALYAYTGPPFRLKYRALGELLIFLIFGPALMVGAAYVQTGHIEWPVVYLSIPVGFATTAVLVGNNLRDRDEDRVAGIHTLAQIAGGRVAKLAYILLLVGCVSGMALLGALGRRPHVLVAAPLFLLLLRRVLVDVWREKRLTDIDAQTARFESVLLLFLLVAELIHRLS